MLRASLEVLFLHQNTRQKQPLIFRRSCKFFGEKTIVAFFFLSLLCLLRFVFSFLLPLCIEYVFTCFSYLGSSPSLSLSALKKCERWARLRCCLRVLPRGVYSVCRGGVFVEEERVVFRELDWRHQHHRTIFHHPTTTRRRRKRAEERRRQQQKRVRRRRKSNINIKTVLRFDVVAKLKPGETLKIVGSIPELGNWDCEKWVGVSVVGKSPVERFD